MQLSNFRRLRQQFLHSIGVWVRGARADSAQLPFAHLALNSQSLAAYFALHRVNKGAYSIGSASAQSNMHVLSAEAGEWHVYYFVDGARRDERIFAEEAGACAELRYRVVGIPHNFL